MLQCMCMMSPSTDIFWYNAEHLHSLYDETSVGSRNQSLSERFTVHRFASYLSALNILCYHSFTGPRYYMSCNIFNTPVFMLGRARYCQFPSSRLCCLLRTVVLYAETSLSSPMPPGNIPNMSKRHRFVLFVSVVLMALASKPRRMMYVIEIDYFGAEFYAFKPV